MSARTTRPPRAPSTSRTPPEPPVLGGRASRARSAPGEGSPSLRASRARARSRASFRGSSHRWRRRRRRRPRHWKRRLQGRRAARHRRLEPESAARRLQGIRPGGSLCVTVGAAGSRMLEKCESELSPQRTVPPGLEHPCKWGFCGAQRGTGGGTPVLRRSRLTRLVTSETASLIRRKCSARPSRRRDLEVGTDLACKPEVDLAVAWDGSRTLGVKAREVWLPPSRNNRAP